MKINQQTATCADEKLESIADAIELIRDAIQTGNEDVINAAVYAMKDNPDLPFHFIVSALELKGKIEKDENLARTSRS